MKYYLKFIFSIFCILVMGLANLIPSRRKYFEEKLNPMGCKPAIIPPGYKCKLVNPIQPAELSARIKAYTINSFKDLAVCKTKEGPLEYLPSEKVSEISYHIKNEFAYKNQLTA